MPPVRAVSKKPTKADIENELIEARGENDTQLGMARARLHQRIHEDIDWWYEVAKALVVFGDSRTDQVKATVLKAILDKIAPDLKALSRGSGGTKAAALVNIGIGSMRKHRRRPPINVTPTPPDPEPGEGEPSDG